MPSGRNFEFNVAGGNPVILDVLPRESAKLPRTFTTEFRYNVGRRLMNPTDAVTSMTEAQRKCATANTLKQFLLENFNVSAEHLDFLDDYGGTVKLRSFFFEVLCFDLEFGVNTSGFVSEQTFGALATTESTLFASTRSAKAGVKFRSSITMDVEHALADACKMFLYEGFEVESLEFFDLGCGAGKPLLIAMANDLPFTRATGVEYFSPLLDQAKQNIHDFHGEIYHEGIELVHADAREFDEYSDTSIVFLYNPFGEEIVADVEQILRRLSDCAIIYVKPLHRNCFVDNGWRMTHSYSKLHFDIAILGREC